MKYNEAVESLICKGLRPAKVARIIGTSKQNVWGYVSRRSRLFSTHQEKRRVVRRVRNLVSLVEDYIAQRNINELRVIAHNYFDEVLGKGSVESLALKGALRYLSNPATKAPFEKLFSVAHAYLRAREEGGRMSLSKLALIFAKGDKAPKDAYIRSILISMGLKSASDLEMKNVPDEQISLLRRAADLDFLNLRDIAYFTGIMPYNVPNNLKRLGLRRNRLKIKYVAGRHVFGLRWASQVYEAVDAGLDEREIAEYTGLETEVIRYYLSSREEVEGRLVDCLRKIFPDRTVTKPYKTWK